MIKLNKTTQRAKNFIRSYQYSNYNDIFQCYTTPSQTKISTFYELKRKYKNYRLRITSHGVQQYSIGYRKNNDLYIVTSCNHFKIENAFA